MGLLSLAFSAAFSLLQLLVDPRCVPIQFHDGRACVCYNSTCDISRPIPTNFQSAFFFHVQTTQKSDRLARRIKPLNATGRTTDYFIDIDLKNQGQTIVGWGGTITDAAVININSLRSDARQKLLQSYFADTGLQFTLCRVPIGSTDFSETMYSYDPFSADVNLTKFNLMPIDYNGRIPIINEAKSIAESLNFFASASSAPIWMQKNSEISKEYLSTWTNYHIKFLDAYREQGINFWGLSTGYEPVSHDVSVLDHIQWDPKSMSNWISNYLGPAIRNNINYGDINLITYDDKRSRLLWSLRGLFTPNSSDFIQGVAVHSGTNIFSFFNQIRKLYPNFFYLSSDFVADKNKHTDIKFGSWSEAENYAKNVIKDLNNGVVGHVDFNLALNMEGGPTQFGKYGNAPILVSATANAFYKQPLFYIIGHFSKYILPGSVHLNSYHNLKHMDVTVFQRPDKGIVINILNRSSKSRQINVMIQGVPKYTVWIKNRSMNSLIYWV